MKIHQNDPIFESALKSKWNKIKFIFSFGSKLAKQKRYILLENKLPAGALSLEIRKYSIFIYAIGLLEKYRRKGYGTILMNFTEEFAKKKLKKFICFSVLLDNKPAIRLYEKLQYNSLGVGLTLLRLFLWKFNDELKDLTSAEIHLSFKSIKRKKDKEKNCFNWWFEEIRYLVDKEGLFLAKEDNLLDFDFKPQWITYDIYTNSIKSGNLIIIPSNLFQTILLFSDPKLTWNKNWFYTFLSTIFDQKIITKKYLQDSDKSKNQIKLDRTSILQIFLTHQHKDNIMSFFGKDLAVHDQTEDRQIFYKIIHYD